MAFDPAQVEAHAATYTELLRHYCQTPDEIWLAQLNDLGRRLVQDEVPPEEIAGFQGQAFEQLGSTAVATALPHITAPLAEVLMAYGLSFREHLEERYTALLQTRLQQGERLEALGTLAAGIAHDFNTLLGVILGFTEMTLDAHPLGSRERSNLEQVLIAVQRARDLVAKILTFARREQNPHREVVSLSEVLVESLALLRPTLPPGIVVQTRVEIPEAQVLADPGELRQIVINLAVNAADAMAGFGTLTLAVLPVSEPPAELPPGNYLALVTQDTGGGIPPHLLSRVFDPFFTTKAPGHGNGLGLSVVHGIVRRMDGIIRVSSTTGQGTAFEVVLPQWLVSKL
ncbi:Histidine kinase [Gammaproteobacteria bacterium]